MQVVIDVQNPGQVHRFGYPGGERQARIIAPHIEAVKAAELVVVVSRVQSSNDLMDTILIGNAIRGIRASIKQNQYADLLLPYLPYARADRQFTEGDSIGIEVMWQSIKAQFGDVYTIDKHSNIMRSISSMVPEEAIIDCLKHFEHGVKQLAVLLPDKGAYLRYVNLIPKGYTVYNATKVRDEVTGKLSGFEVPDLSHYDGVLIIDDIIDGGGTFLGIADKLPKGIKLGLFGTHGIFSKGYDILKDGGFTHLYTTDTWSPAIEPELTYKFPVVDTAVDNIIDYSLRGQNDD